MIIVLFFASAVQAAPKADCRETASTSYELSECAHQHYLEADRALNVQWRTTAVAAQRLNKAAYPRLLNGQRAWLRYRDETCGWVKDAFGGTIAAMNFFDCMEDITRKRTEELKMLATNPNSGEQL